MEFVCQVELHSSLSSIRIKVPTPGLTGYSFLRKQVHPEVVVHVLVSALGGKSLSSRPA